MSKKKSPTRNAWGQLAMHQAHANDHYFQNRRADYGIPGRVCGGTFGFPAAARTMHCPICALPYSLDKMGFTQDHAPQKGEQSALGAAHAVVLTCAGKDGCNNFAGGDYESAAAAIRNFGDEVDLPELRCAFHGNARIEMRNGLYHIVDKTPLELNDLKAAFLMAFATLGYGWALHPSLRPIRRALRTGKLPRDIPAVMCGIQSDNHVGESVVLEVAGQQPCTVILAADGKAVLMPIPGHTAVPQQLDLVQARTHLWPSTLGNHRNISDEFDAGHLFHADFCADKPSHRWP